MSSVHETVEAVTRRLQAAGVATPGVDAQWLVCEALGVTPSELAMRPADPLRANDEARLLEMVARRERREPLQLVLGSVGFRYLELEVRPGVFIPRPETELLAGLAVELLPAGGVVVEPCTGTGAVACAVAFEGAPSRVVATDVDPRAVALARANATRLGLAVDVMQGDLLDPVHELRGRIDVLVSNPPYLASDEIGALDDEVRDWDPLDALVAGPTGHECSDRLVAAAPDWLAAGGWLLLEVSESRAHETARRAMAAGLEDVEVRADLAGRPRMVCARRAHGRTIRSSSRRRDSCRK